MAERILVTGGAGYIGSHMVLALAEAGYDVLTYDNLSTGNRWAVLAGEFVHGDLADLDLLRGAVRRFRPVAAIHFAASIEVGESVSDPLKYYMNNTVNLLNTAMVLNVLNVKKMVFSSSAAVYGVPESNPVAESAVLNPINPYGASKMMSERILDDLGRADEEFKNISLRYFNVAGAHSGGRLGQAYRNPTHLITRALKTARGEYDRLQVFGNDYPTPDGTGVRDYIHVDDLVSAHLASLEHLLHEGHGGVFNCGYNRGYSVRQVIETVRRVTGKTVVVEDRDRREGDPAELVADSSLIREKLGWKPEHDDLEEIIRTAWKWENTLQSSGLEKREKN